MSNHKRRVTSFSPDGRRHDEVCTTLSDLDLKELVPRNLLEASRQQRHCTLLDKLGRIRTSFLNLRADEKQQLCC